MSHNPARVIRWAYGVTTVPERKLTTLPRTLQSLSGAGFDKPRLFVDGCSPDEASDYHHEFMLPVTSRNPRIVGEGWTNCGVFGNWLMALMELYIRQPICDRYAIFQDDLVAVKNLRSYLDKLSFPDGYNGRYKGYWNLYTFPENEQYRANGNKPILQPAGAQRGFFDGANMGRGALGLVFNREQVRELLSSKITLDKFCDGHRGWRSVDGHVVTVLSYGLGFRELVHHPSLLQHTGAVSSMPTQLRHPEALDFPGEDFDALKFLEGI